MNCMRQRCLSVLLSLSAISCSPLFAATSVPMNNVHGLRLLWVDASANQNYTPGYAVNTPPQSAYFTTLAERVAAHEPFGWQWNRVVMSAVNPGSNSAYAIPVKGTQLSASDLKASKDQSVFFTDFMQNPKLAADVGVQIMVNPYIAHGESAWTGFNAGDCISKVSGALDSSESYKLPDASVVTSVICWANAAQTYLHGLDVPTKLITGIAFDFQGAGIKDGRAVALIRKGMNVMSYTKTMKLAATGSFRNLAWYNQGTWKSPASDFSQLDELYIQNYNVWVDNCAPNAPTCGGKYKYTYVGARSRGASGAPDPEGFMPIQMQNGQYTGNSVYTEALQATDPVSALLPDVPDKTNNGVNLLYILYNPNGKIPGAAQYNGDNFFDQNTDQTLFGRMFFMFSTECTSGSSTDGCAEMVSYPAVASGGAGAGAINAFGARANGKGYSAQDVKDAVERFEQQTKGAFGKHAKFIPMNVGIYQYQMMPQVWFQQPAVR